MPAYVGSQTIGDPLPVGGDATVCRSRDFARYIRHYVPVGVVVREIGVPDLADLVANNALQVERVERDRLRHDDGERIGAVPYLRASRAARRRKHTQHRARQDRNPHSPYDLTKYVLNKDRMSSAGVVISKSGPFFICAATLLASRLALVLVTFRKIVPTDFVNIATGLIGERSAEDAVDDDRAGRSRSLLVRCPERLTVGRIVSFNRSFWLAGGVVNDTARRPDVAVGQHRV